MAMKTFLPPGFRFSPTDVELVWYYLKRKVMGKHFRFKAISEVELYKFSPWELPEKSQLHTKDLEWYFFCPRDRKYPNGPRTNRATDGGYWKATGRDRPVIHKSCTVGMKKTLIFHVGKPPNGDRTNWVMYEYRLESKELVDAGCSQDAYVLCKIFQKSGLGPKIGEQYGAPFNEEDWEEVTATECSFLLPSVPCPGPEPSNNHSTVLNPVAQQPIPSHAIEVPSDPDADGIFLGDLAAFLNISPPRENANNEMVDSTNLGMNVNGTTEVDQEDLFKELEALCSQAVISGDMNPAEDIQNELILHPVQPELDSGQYLELNDLYFIGDSNPSESIVPSDPFAPYSPTHCPIFQNPSHLNDISSYLNDDGYGMYLPHDTGPLTSARSPLSMQTGDFVGFVLHLNDPVSELEQRLLQEHSPALLRGPFR